MDAQTCASASCACGCGKPQRPTSKYATESCRNREDVRRHRQRKTTFAGVDLAHEEEIVDLVAAGKFTPSDALLWVRFPREMAELFNERQTRWAA